MKSNTVNQTRSIAVEQIGVRYQYDQIANNVGEFLDGSDGETTVCITRLLNVFAQRSTIAHDHLDCQEQLCRNVCATIILVRTLHNYNQYGDMRCLATDGELSWWKNCLLKFVKNSDEGTAGWLEYLLSEYIAAGVSDSPIPFDQLYRNIRQTIELVRTLHEHNRVGGIHKLGR